MILMLLLLGAFSVYAPGSVAAAQDGDYSYTMNGSPVVATITGYSGAGGAITIPSSLGGYPVVAIGDSAFQNQESITSVIMPNGVITIGYNAFVSCMNLTSVLIGDGATSIGGYAFDHCTSISSVTIPASVTSIGYGAFYQCTSLTSVTMPGSVTSIGHDAFSTCTALTSVSIPSSLISIGDYAFNHCTAMTAIVVDASNPNYANKEGDGVLYDKAIHTLIQYPAGKVGTSFMVPNTVTSIGNNAFYYCAALTSVTIPNGVASIGEYAFNHCSSLTAVNFLEVVAPTVGQGWIGSTPAAIRGHAYNASSFPEPGGVWNGLTMGAVIYPGVPGEPTGLSAVVGNAQVIVSWTASVDNGDAITNYHVFRSTTENGTYDLIASPIGLNYTDVGLTNGLTYRYKVAASNAVGWGPNSSVNAMPQGPPSEARGLKASQGDGSIHLNWTVPQYVGPGTVIYHLFRGGVEVWNGTTTTHDDTGLINGQGYEYKVAASNSVGWGANSTNIQATPAAPSPSNNGDTIMIIAIVAVIAIAGIGAALLFMRRKK